MRINFVEQVQNGFLKRLKGEATSLGASVSPRMVGQDSSLLAVLLPGTGKIGITINGVLDQAGKYVDVLPFPPSVPVPLGCASTCRQPFVLRHGSGVVVLDDLAVRIAVTQTRLILSQRAPVLEDGSKIGARPMLPQKVRHTFIQETLDDERKAITVCRQLEDALHDGSEFRLQPTLAVLLFDPAGQLPREAPSVFSRRFPLAFPGFSVAHGLYLTLGIATHELHGGLEEVSVVLAVVAQQLHPIEPADMDTKGTQLGHKADGSPGILEIGRAHV